MKAKGPVLLLITAALWGMAFVAQTSAAENVEPFTTSMPNDTGTTQG